MTDLTDYILFIPNPVPSYAPKRLNFPSVNYQLMSRAPTNEDTQRQPNH